MAKKNEVAELTAEQLAFLNESYPVSEESNRLTLPRFGMLSKDIVEETGTGKNKKIKVVEAAGTFYTERDLGEVDEETGKKKWTKEFIKDDSLEIVIVYHRRQLRKFDSSLEKFISSPIFDNSEQIIPLYLDKQVIKRGTQKELQALYPALTQKGKPTSDLKEETILYIIYNNELYQFNLSQSSKWEFKTYIRNLNPSTVKTTIASAEETFGKNTYKKTVFLKGIQISLDTFNKVVESQGMIKAVVESDQRFLSSTTEEGKKLDDELDQLAAKNF